ncbi:SulP family inorganic anion transporter [Deinococcus peraridilitoris]|uniref:Sulfate permease-like transporter, MFS superfamily n=1 Tax=Deinococcus peraridilitoris (strain DSM 19664 / LMG 22246 / CIP 109416 / KR-200) TaxID=937777 RepID=L0A656_DEIPD|nr:SulP family inorganic anion transporter [Deinococcus peraridilitoris]AFZ68934.1 sulfate permease-like transporter, MFS superfamily [Deinococcus peraridilitoris DSM 19664]
MTLAQYKKEWFGNIRGDFLAGLVVALALIPEAIAFSIIAGVDPKVGLYASFSIAVITAFIGGRPGMISAATGAMALLMIDLVKDHGLPYLFAATVLTGFIQILFGWAKLARYLKFVPRSVMTGFVNALAILIFLAQLPQFVGANWQMYAMVAAGLAIIYLLPKIIPAVPSALVAIVALTAVAIFTGANVRTVGDMGELPSTLPFFALPQVPFTLETLMIIAPVAFTLAIVGLLESLLTAQIVDDLTLSTSDKNQESNAQGVANIATGFLGGMAGCAMIGQSVINVTSGGRGRLSAFTAGVVLLILILVLQPLVIQIPMAALVAVMFVVAISTFDWSSFKSLRTFPKSESIVMVSTVAATVITHDLSIGVLVGVVLSAIFFARKVSQLSSVTSELSPDGRTRTYHVLGQMFFVSSHEFVHSFDVQENIDKAVIDLTHAHLWDGSAVGAIDKVALNFMRQGVKVELVGLNEASSTLIDRIAVHDKLGALGRTPGH